MGSQRPSLPHQIGTPKPDLSNEIDVHPCHMGWLMNSFIKAGRRSPREGMLHLSNFWSKELEELTEAVFLPLELKSTHC